LKFTIRLPHELIVLVALSIVVVITARVWQAPPLRITLGLLYVLFLPGYALVAALFPGRHDLQGIRRLTLSLVSSLATVSLLTLALNWMPWGVRLDPILASVTSFIVVTCGVAWYRRSRLPLEERFLPRLEVRLPSWSNRSLFDRSLSAGLILSIILGTSTVVYFVLRPKVSERYTEFYVLGADGLLAGYPEEAVAGEPITLVLGIVNGEHDHVHYRVERDISGRERAEIARIELADGQQWEEPLTFSMSLPEGGGDACYLEKLSFLLYKDDQTEPYRTVYLEVALLPDEAPTVSPTPTPQPSPTAAPGQSLSPSPTGTPTPSPTATPAFEPTRGLTASEIHIVQRGETLSAISRQYGVSLDALIRANALSDPDLLDVGQEILIPPSNDT